MAERKDITRDMEWYVLLHEFNGDKIVMWNIFRSVRFSEGVSNALKNYITFDDFKEKIKTEAMCAFWAKAEYEIAVGGLFSKYPERFEKIDVYTQLKDNIDILAHYIIETYNNAPKRRKTLK